MSICIRRPLNPGWIRRFAAHNLHYVLKELAPPPALVRTGERASRRFIEFFTASNRNTGVAYARAVKQFFDWCDGRRPKRQQCQQPTVKQHLAAIPIRQLFDYLTNGGILEVNPAASVRGPKYVVKRGKTPVLSGRGGR